MLVVDDLPLLHSVIWTLGGAKQDEASKVEVKVAAV
jgi:hypothetical protein